MLPGRPQLADQVKPHVAIYGAHGIASPYFDITAFAPVTTAALAAQALVLSEGWNTIILILVSSGLSRWEYEGTVSDRSMNLTNHPNFSNPDNGVTDSDSGLITSINPTWFAA
jgi:hypothetical protein